MTQKLHPVRTQSAPNADRNPPHDSVSVARLGMISTLGAAVVTGIVTIVTQIGPPSPENMVKETRSGISYDYNADYVKSEVTINGDATDDIDEVAVLIGPRPSGGKYWGERVRVVDGLWNVTVKTDPSLPKPYEIQAIPHSNHRDTALGTNTIQFYSFGSGDTATPPPPPPPDPLQCAEQEGPSCFSGPGWGTPVISQSGG